MKHALTYAEFKCLWCVSWSSPLGRGYTRSLGKQGSGEKVWTRSAQALRCHRNWEIGLSSGITEPLPWFGGRLKRKMLPMGRRWAFREMPEEVRKFWALVLLIRVVRLANTIVDTDVVGIWYSHSGQSFGITCHRIKQLHFGLLIPKTWKFMLM